MTAVYDTYGTSTHSAEQLAGLLTDRLGAVFTERDSHYLGVYWLATLDNATRIQIQPNAIPGDEGYDDLYAEQHPDVPLLVLITAPSADLALREQLAAVRGLARLTASES